MNSYLNFISLISNLNSIVDVYSSSSLKKVASGSSPQSAKFIYECNNVIHVWICCHEFIVLTMNSYAHEFSFSEFISIWIHMLISSADSEYVWECDNCDFSHEFILEFKNEFIYESGSQLFLTNAFSAIFINSYTN